MYIWADPEFLSRNSVKNTLLENSIAPIITGRDISFILANKLENVLFEFTFNPDGWSKRQEKCYLDEPISTQKDVTIQNPNEYLTVGESSTEHIKKLIDLGIRNITFTSYGNHLFGFTLPRWKWLGGLSGLRINIRGCRNQIPTWDWIEARYPQQFKMVWISLYQNQNDYGDLVRWAIQHNKAIGIVSSKNQSYEDAYTELLKLISVYNYLMES